MGQVEDILEMSNKEAADILKTGMSRVGICFGRVSGKSFMILQQMQALLKAIELLEKTPDKPKRKRISDDYLKLCPDCDGKASHPAQDYICMFDSRFVHKCPRCGKTWNDYYDE